MSELNDRIARFEHMTRADPTNDMAHFSLGSAYMQAKRFAEAAKSFERCTELNGEMSKAYQLAGEAMIEAGWSDKAAEVLARGHGVASRKGDQMPLRAIEALFERLGRTPPKSSAATTAAASPGGGGGFVCQRTGRPGTRLATPPMRGPIGRWIHENISAETWQSWVGQGTKVINELRLDFSKDDDQATYDRYMEEYLGIDESLKSRLRAEHAAERATT